MNNQILAMQGDFAFRCLRSPFLEKRLHGLKSLLTMVEAENLHRKTQMMRAIVVTSAT